MFACIGVHEDTLFVLLTFRYIDDCNFMSLSTKKKLHVFYFDFMRQVTDFHQTHEQ